MRILVLFFLLLTIYYVAGFQIYNASAGDTDLENKPPELHRKIVTVLLFTVPPIGIMLYVPLLYMIIFHRKKYMVEQEKCI